MTATQQTTVEWAKEFGTMFRYIAQLDNREPSLKDTWGVGWFFNRPGYPVNDGVILEKAEDFRDAHQAVYLLDNGLGVAPYYVAAWHAEQGFVILHPFPLSIGRRTDNGEPIDASNWRLGPRRCYHLKIKVGR